MKFVDAPKSFSAEATAVELGETTLHYGERTKLMEADQRLRSYRASEWRKVIGLWCVRSSNIDQRGGLCYACLKDGVVGPEGEGIGSGREQSRHVGGGRSDTATCVQHRIVQQVSYTHLDVRGIEVR